MWDICTTRRRNIRRLTVGRSPEERHYVTRTTADYRMPYYAPPDCGVPYNAPPCCGPLYKGATDNKERRSMASLGAVRTLFRMVIYMPPYLGALCRMGHITGRRARFAVAVMCVFFQVRITIYDQHFANSSWQQLLTIFVLSHIHPVTLHAIIHCMTVRKLSHWFCNCSILYC